MHVTQGCDRDVWGDDVVLGRPVDREIRRRPPPPRQVCLPDLRARECQARVDTPRVLPPYATQIRVIMGVIRVHEPRQQLRWCRDCVRIWKHDASVGAATRHPFSWPLPGPARVAHNAVDQPPCGVHIPELIVRVSYPLCERLAVAAGVTPCNLEASIPTTNVLQGRIYPLTIHLPSSHRHNRHQHTEQTWHLLVKLLHVSLALSLLSQQVLHCLRQQRLRRITTTYRSPGHAPRLQPPMHPSRRPALESLPCRHCPLGAGSARWLAAPP